MLMKSKTLAPLSLAFLSGCTGQYYRIPAPEYDRAKYEEVGRRSETATGIMLLGFIPINENDKIERATTKIVSDAQGDVITDVTVRERCFWAYVLNGYKIDVEGMVLSKKPESSHRAAHPR